MNSANDVARLLEDLKAAGKTGPEIIHQIAVACLGWPYVFGAWGEMCTPSGRKRRASDAHPTIVSKCQVLSGKKSDCAGCKWGIGVRMYDCRGFTHWLLDQVGITIKGQGATSQWNTAANWQQKGDIGTMPDVVCCVFKQKGSTMEHTGMHIGGGRIIHCSSGVQEGKTSDKGWTHYAIPAGLYEAAPAPEPAPKPAEPTHRTLRINSRGDDVKQLQERLADLGYTPGAADGIFGSRTAAAVKAFQADHALAVDGIVGPLTWAALDAAKAGGPDPVELDTYRVIIEGVTWAQYRKILEICPLADAIREG